MNTAEVLKGYTFKAGDMAVHPAHGVGEVEQLEDRDLGGRKTTCYVIKIKDSGLKVRAKLLRVARVVRGGKGD